MSVACLPSFVPLPPLAWNCHVHSFDPENHPFKPSRAYTPAEAPLESLFENAFTDQIMIVQASVEDGYDGLLDHLNTSRHHHPNKRIMGTMVWDPEDEQALKNLTDSDFDALHEQGIRSVRIHGSYGGSGGNPNWVLDQILQVTEYCPIYRHGWSISAQLPLATWSNLTDKLLSHPRLANVSIIADHNGSATPKDKDTPELKDFLRLLKSGRFYVKLGALHRRSPKNIAMMKPIIKSMAGTAEDALLWGSDWPHVNTTGKGLTPTPHLANVDTNKELVLLHSWLTKAQWHKMLVSNPARAFGIKDQ